MRVRPACQGLSLAKALVPFLLAAAAAPALSQNLMTRTSAGWTVEGVGKTWTAGNITSSPPPNVWQPPAGSITGTIHGGGTFESGPSGPQHRSSGRFDIPNSGGRHIPVTATASVSKTAAAATMARWAMRLTGPIGAAYTAYEVYNYFASRGVTIVDGQWAGPHPDTCVSNCKTVRYTSQGGSTSYNRSALTSCQELVTVNNASSARFWNYSNPRVSGTRAASNEVCTTLRTDKNTGTVVGDLAHQPTYQSATPYTGDPVPMTEQQLADKIASESGWPTDASRALSEALRQGETVAVGTPTLSGPATVSGPSSTTTESVKKPDGTPGTKTTVTNTTYNNTYNNNTVTVTVTNTASSTTTYTDGTTETDTKTENEEPQEPQIPVDQPLGELPKLYEPKYPGGPAALWNTKIAEIKAAPLFTLPGLLTPNLGDSGGCPNWSIPVNVGTQNWGTYSTDIPCWLWTFLRVCVLISAAFLARKLIFGG